jgi:hypothetical protein
MFVLHRMRNISLLTERASAHQERLLMKLVPLKLTHFGYFQLLNSCSVEKNLIESLWNYNTLEVVVT